MSQQTARYLVELIARDAGLRAAFERAASDGEKAGKRIENAMGGSLARTGSQALNLARSFAGAFGFGLGAGAAAAALTVIAQKTMEGERSQAALQVTLRATGREAELTAYKIKGLADEMQRRTIFDDDAINRATTALARFGSVTGATFEKALRLAPDVATAIGSDLPAAATLIGRALTEPMTVIKQLKALGVELSQSQIDLARHFMETGREADAQAIILDELAKKVGGLSEADNKGLYGSTKRLSRAWDDLEKAIGKRLFGGVPEAVDGVAGSVKSLADNLEKASGMWAKFVAGAPMLAIMARSFGLLDRQLPAGRTLETMVPSRSANISGIIAYQKAAIAKKQKEDNKAYEAEKHATERNAQTFALLQTGILQDRLARLGEETQAVQAAYARQEIAADEYFNRVRALNQQEAQARRDLLSGQLEALSPIANAPEKFGRERSEQARDQMLALANQSQALLLQQRERERGFEIERTDALRKFRDEVEATGAAVLELTGAPGEAAAARFAVAHRDAIRKLNIERERGTAESQKLAEIGLSYLNTLREQGVAAAELAGTQRETARAMEALDVAQRRVALAREAGAITELQSLALQSRVNREMIPILERQLELELAKANVLAPGSEARDTAIARIKRLQLAIEEAAASTDLLERKLNDIGASALSDALTELASGSKSIRDVLRELERSLGGQISRLAANGISQSLFGKGGALSGFGGFLGKIFGGSGGLAEGGMAAINGPAAAAAGGLAALPAPAAAAAAGLAAIPAAAASAAAALSGVQTFAVPAQDLISGISSGGNWSGGVDWTDIIGGAFAAGGNPPVGRLSLVGERGPELIVPRSPVTVVPNGARGRGARNVSIVVTVPAGTSRETADQVAARTARAVQRAARRVL